MAYVLSSTTINIQAYLTQYGRELYIMGDDNDIITKYFTLSDDDTNYFLAFNNVVLNNGEIPDITGDNEGCIKSVAKGVGLKYPINLSTTKKGDIIREFCQPPHTLVQEISNGDGTTYLNTIENSIKCGFVFKSNVFSQSFTRENCGVNGVGQDYLVQTSFGQFTGTTQNEADQKALDYIQISGQTLANQFGTCRFGNQKQTLSGFQNQNCDNPKPYTAVAEANTVFSTISVQDANNNALIFLQQNGQSLANQFGECSQIIGFNTIPGDEFLLVLSNQQITRIAQGGLYVVESTYNTTIFDQSTGLFLTSENIGLRKTTDFVNSQPIFVVQNAIRIATDIILNSNKNTFNKYINPEITVSYSTQTQGTVDYEIDGLSFGGGVNFNMSKASSIITGLNVVDTYVTTPRLNTNNRLDRINISGIRVLKDLSNITGITVRIKLNEAIPIFS